jgi:mannose-1-phosphate guanylyltransferase
MQALILAGGEGTRLRPLTSTVPKPVVPLVDRPFIRFMLDWLRGHGVNDVVMSCGHLASGVRNVLGDGSAFGIALRYVEEPRPLGTGGALKYAEPLLDDRFLMLNGDVLTDMDLTTQMAQHEQTGAVATLALTPVEDPSAYGLVRTADDGRIEAFLEKPKPHEIDTNLINAGAYMLEREVLDRIEPGRPTSFEREVFPGLIGAGLYGFEVSGYWLDIGTPERYLEATHDILEGTVATSLDGELGDDRLGVPADTELAPGAQLLAPTLLGRGCAIAAGARIGRHAVVGDRCRVADSAVVEEAVLHGSVELGAGALVRESIVGEGASIGADCRIEGGSVIGAGAVIAPGTALAHGERVEPAPAARGQ